MIRPSHTVLVVSSSVIVIERYNRYVSSVVCLT
ncbi:hypothetical protein D791_01889 [Nitrincola nitratireducens]|uniref:Uncharacterized protein n=1 Tax=Nitrincola nitratireducens TaxID=1229521 RepID=W9UV28_9GAMM|nr:hypothetical protein D791_01889 [Nitrincola nitratireducens]